MLSEKAFVSPLPEPEELDAADGIVVNIIDEPVPNTKFGIASRCHC